MQRRFAPFVAPAQRLEFEQFLARVLRTDATQSCELPLLRDDGTPFHGQLEGLRVATPAGLQCRLAVLDISARQQEVLAAILTTQETERKRIAEALHNGLCQLLYATKLSLEGRCGTSVSVRESLKLLSGPPALFPSSSRWVFSKILSCAPRWRSWPSTLPRPTYPYACHCPLRVPHEVRQQPERQAR